MCGLVGVAGTLEAKHISAFNTLLTIDAVRGKDSTGVAGVNRHDRGIEVVKRACTPIELMDGRTYDRVVSQGKQVLIGHNRSATTGSVNNRNAHPFDFYNIVGAHNGTLAFSSKSRLEGKDYFGTDSEALFSRLDDETLADTMAMVEGAYSLTWYDNRDDTINFLRNSARPMCYVFSDDGKSIFWASEAWMLYGPLARHGIKHGENQVYSTAEDEHLSWVIPKRGEVFGEVRRERVLGKPQPVTTPYLGTSSMGSGGGSTPANFPQARTGAGAWSPGKIWKDGKYIDDPSKAQAPVSTTEEKAGTPPTTSTPTANLPAVVTPTKIEETIVTPARVVVGPRTHHLHKDHKGRILTREQFEEQAKDGCSWCGADIEFGDNCKIVDDHTVLCQRPGCETANMDEDDLSIFNVMRKVSASVS